MTSDETAALEALERLYRAMDDAPPAGECRMCGRCCRFESFGHRLYATYLEALYLVTRTGAPPRAFGDDACGYQDGARCLAREGRTLGCRMFLCGDCGGPSVDAYESALGEIRRISQARGLAWNYSPLGEHMKRLCGGAL